MTDRSNANPGLIVSEPSLIGAVKCATIEIEGTNLTVKASFTDRQQVINFLDKWMPETKPPF